jgi:hypothetical protein
LVVGGGVVDRGVGVMVVVDDDEEDDCLEEYTVLGLLMLVKNEPRADRTVDMMREGLVLLLLLLCGGA